MDYVKLLNTATDVGYHLAMSGAETYRIEESIIRILKAYNIDSEVYAIPNCLIVSMETPEGTPLTHMRRIGIHGNDLDAVERFTGLSRRICAEKPEPEIAGQWLAETVTKRKTYSLPAYLLGTFIAAAGIDFLFGGSYMDALCAGICGILVGLLNRLMDHLGANQFFRTVTATFMLSIVAYAMNAFGMTQNPDVVIIGALMILVPGLLFTNAMRDIIHGDTNSGIIRIVQVLLIALAIALGTGAAWNVANQFWSLNIVAADIHYHILIQSAACLVGCTGFAIIFRQRIYLDHLLDLHGADRKRSCRLLLGNDFCRAIQRNFGPDPEISGHLLLAGLHNPPYSRCGCVLHHEPPCARANGCIYQQRLSHHCRSGNSGGGDPFGIYCGKDHNRKNCKTLKSRSLRLLLFLHLLVPSPAEVFYPPWKKDPAFHTYPVAGHGYGAAIVSAATGALSHDCRKPEWPALPCRAKQQGGYTEDIPAYR